MTADQSLTVPPLPDPHCYEWDGPFGTRKFSTAPHNGRQCDRSVPLFTESQLRDYARAAIEDDRRRIEQAYLYWLGLPGNSDSIEHRCARAVLAAIRGVPS